MALLRLEKSVMLTSGCTPYILLTILLDLLKTILGIFSDASTKLVWNCDHVNELGSVCSDLWLTDWTLHNSFFAANYREIHLCMKHACSDQRVDKDGLKNIWWVKAIQVIMFVFKNFAKCYGGNILRILQNIASSHPFLIPSIPDQEPRNFLDSYSYSQGFRQKFTSQSYGRFKLT